MWMSARRFVVMTRFVRVAFGNTNRASSPGHARPEQLAVQAERAVDLLLVALAQLRIALGDGVGEHRGRALELDVALALLVERDARAVAHELVRQRPRHAADGEREDDVLDRRAVPGLDDRADQLLHLERVEVAVDRAPEDLVGVLLRVARPAGRVDDRDVELLDDLAVREEQRGPQAEVAPARVLRDPGLLARRVGRRVRSSSEGQSSRVGHRRRRGRSGRRVPREPAARLARAAIRPSSAGPRRRPVLDGLADRALEGIGDRLVEGHRRAFGSVSGDVRLGHVRHGRRAACPPRTSPRRSRPAPSRSRS